MKFNWLDFFGSKLTYLILIFNINVLNILNNNTPHFIHIKILSIKRF